jgi:hypothetical protein
MDTQQNTEESDLTSISPLQIGMLCAIIWFLLLSIYIILSRGFLGWYDRIGIYILESLFMGLISFIFEFYRRKKRNKAE